MAADHVNSGIVADNAPVILHSKEDVVRIVSSERPVSRRNWLIILIALGGIFIDAYDFTSLGIGVTQLKAQFHLNPAQLGSVTQSLLRVGSTMGFYFFPLLLAAVGLYPTLLLLAIVPFIGLVVTLIIKWDPVLQKINVDEEEETTPALEGVSTEFA